MVSPISEGSASSVAPNRGFVPVETFVATGPGNAQLTLYRPFWRPVLAGTLFTLSLFTLSWFLMLGCHVGIQGDGNLDLGGGAAVWLWVTACIAYFAGGYIAGSMTALPTDANAYGLQSAGPKGAVLWALSIPLALIIYALVWQSGTGGMLLSLNLPHPNMTEAARNPGTPHLGFYWCVFIGLALGLVTAIAGNMAACSRPTTPKT